VHFSIILASFSVSMSNGLFSVIIPELPGKINSPAYCAEISCIFWKYLVLCLLRSPLSGGRLARSRGPETSDYIKKPALQYIQRHKRESVEKKASLRSVPIGDVLGIMSALIVGFVNIVVILLIALIGSKK
jgi:hypothetical protein